MDVESGRVVQVILSTGGFLGIGESLSAVPPGALHHDVAAKVLHLDANKEKLRTSPRFESAKWAEQFDTDRLGSVYRHYREETAGHVKMLEQVFQCFDRTAMGKKCEATLGLLKEGDEIALHFEGSPAINAALIAVAQKVKHYEIASYGCLHEADQFQSTNRSAFGRTSLDPGRDCRYEINPAAQAEVQETNHGRNHHNEYRNEQRSSQTSGSGCQS